MKMLWFRNKVFILLLKVNWESSQAPTSQGSETDMSDIMLHHLLSAGQHMGLWDLSTCLQKLSG